MYKENVFCLLDLFFKKERNTNIILLERIKGKK